MQRVPTTPRPDWQRTVESQGFLFHTPDGQPYWDESAYYRLTAAEVDAVERATQALDRMCLAAVERVIETDAFAPFQVPPAFWDTVKESWERDELTVYGRFDLAFDGTGEPKLLEYNADTPTSLLEAAVIQWNWYKDFQAAGGEAARDVYTIGVRPPPRAVDQFNSIHERLIEAWRIVRADPGRPRTPLYFTALAGNIEDYMTVTYLRDTAAQAGWDARYLDVEQIGWNADRRRFVDEREREMANVFKLYPWEWMTRERFAPQVLEAGGSTRWLEPPWKMLLSNKAVLPLLWEMFPDSPYLLPASLEPLDGPHVRKPLLGREGANVRRVIGGQVVEETDGPYGGPYVYQALHPMPEFAGNYPVVGSWLVNGYACGLGIREDAGPVTQNTSRFVPHLFVP